ncbi:transaldolase family protein [Streptacidiphilus melanogenes]|uniref:transaldolase family protein n=1 Tax=Streptacidiphilus melanogenes TaxID=411235 RepID=UPI0005A65DE1|nr:transaldolase family protein [Streptacidiphilus melanogenes]
MTVPLGRLTRADTSVWLDGVGRDLLRGGTFARMAALYGVSGAVTGPACLAWPINSTQQYDRELAQCAASGVTAEDALRSLIACNARWACDVLRPLHQASAGMDGWVSVGMDPRPAHDALHTVAEAHAVRQLVGRPNLVVEIPATNAGLQAMRTCLAEGIGVHATRVFSPSRLLRVHEAFQAGLEQAVRAGRGPASAAAFASFAVGHLDQAADVFLARVGTARAERLRGQIAIATARLAHERWQSLAHTGLRAERLLWHVFTVPRRDPAHPRNPAHDDARRAESLSLPGTITLLPEATLRALASHGPGADHVLLGRFPAAREVMDEAAALGLDVEAVAETLARRSLAAAVAGWAELADTVDAAMNGELVRPPAHVQ